MKPSTRLTISVLLAFVSLTTISAQTEMSNDTTKHPIKLKEEKVDPLQLDNKLKKAEELNLDNKGETSQPSLSIPTMEPIDLGDTYLKRSNAVRIEGGSSDFFGRSERMVDFSMTPNENLLLRTSLLLGRYDAPFLQESLNYYSLGVGAELYINPYLSGGAGVFYKSNLNDPSSLTGGYIDLIFTPIDRLQLSNTLTYYNHMSNASHLNQQSIMLDTHLRYRLNEKFYTNFYGGMPLKEMNSNNDQVLPLLPQKYVGGTVEYWFNGAVGVESGVTWKQDLFNQKLIPRPVIGIIIDKSRR